jgi:hypothetical protein
MGICYAFGNSHVSIFSGTDLLTPIWPTICTHDRLPWFRTFRIGPATAFQAEKHLTTIYTIIEQIGFDQANDTCLFVFGEVDIRAHVFAQAEKQSKPIFDIVQDVVRHYFNAIKDAKDRGFKVAVFGCLAGFKLKPGAVQPPWPFVGSCVERNEATKMFNDLIQDNCSCEDIPFISVFEEMLLPNGETKVCYLDTNGAGCHATTKLLPLILWKFRDAGLIPFDAKLCEWEGN